MLQIRPADQRGHSKLDWLDSRFTFPSRITTTLIT
jgi:hypothetical protein